jgi:hypothetical protein
MPGLVVSALLVLDLMVCLRLVCVCQEMIRFIGKDKSVERLRLIGAMMMSGKRVDVGVKVDLNTVGQRRSVA